MREQQLCVAGSCPDTFLCGFLTTMAALFLLSETTSLRGKQLVFTGRTGKYVSLDGHQVDELCMFTVCIDFNKTEESMPSWAAFSYDVNSNSTDFRNTELALSFNKSTLQVFILGNVTELRQDFSPYKMHRVCCVWDGFKRLLEIFHKGMKMRNVTVHNTTRRCLKPYGTLVLGQLHKNQNGQIVTHPSFSFVGILHYFQMWGYVRDQQMMANCDQGNAVSWQGNYWALNRIRTDSDHHQSCGEKEATSTAPPIASKTPESASKETFYKIQMTFSVSSHSLKIFDYYDAMDLSKNWFKEKLRDFIFVITNHHIKSTPQYRVNIQQRSLPVRIKNLTADCTSSWGKLGNISFLGLHLSEFHSHSGTCCLGDSASCSPKNYSSRSIVRITSDKEEIENALRSILDGDYAEEHLSMKVESTNITPFKPNMCPEGKVRTKYKGTYEWPATIPANVAQQTCLRNTEDLASRACAIDINTETAYWRRQNVTSCQLMQDLPDNIVSLQNVTITVDNAENLADHILILLNSSEWNEEEVEVLVDKLTDIANCEEISPTLARKSLQIIDTFMTIEANDHRQEKLNRILELTEEIGFKMSFTGRSASVVMPNLALALIRPDPANFQGIAFEVTSYNTQTDPELNICQTPMAMSLASIFLPRSLGDYLSAQSFEPDDHTEIQFNFFGTPSLFQDSSFENAVLNTYVVGASIENVSVQNLKEPVQITLQHIKQNVNNTEVHCVFWDFNENDSLGGWNTSGCKSVRSNVSYTTCNCTHLTHFGVLLDIYQDPINEADNWNLTLISYVGCGISSIFLGLALAIYLSIDKLRGDYPSKILINLCFALLMLNLVFLVNPWLSSFQKRGLCVTVAAVLHYFLLASFTWMGLEAIHMYYALVKVFNTYIPSYVLKLSIAGWGIPAVIVATVLIISPNFYGTEPVSRSTNPLESFCWIQVKLVFYISVVAYFCLVFLINASMFITVLLQVRAMKANNHFLEDHWTQDVKRVASLTFLLGLTWGFTFFEAKPVRVFFLYLFAICNTLQGFFIFLFHCLMKENVRKQCQVHFCCGRFRLSYSQWRSSATTLGYPPTRHFERKLSSLSLKSLRSCATNSTSNGSGSLAGASPDIGGKTDQIWCRTRSASLTHLEVHLPHGRRVS